MKKLPNLPIGKSSFESIREKGDLYVDKTRHIFQMVDSGEYYFLSRPRRFGKSLTVSTLKSLFLGQKELFEGLWLGKHGNWEWKEHPVIFLDFNGISHDTPENLKISLKERVSELAVTNKIQLKYSLLKDQFKELIISLFRKTGTKVVILIDEYDKPLIDHLGKGADGIKTAKANRDILKSFLGVIKDGDVSSALRFVFITGVSKFTRVSIFSELNNLDDITMNRHYAEMLGYTQDELETCFTGYIEQFAGEYDKSPREIIQQMKKYYNGYRFSQKNVRVYNPFSVLKCLSGQEFGNYWFETGTPTFLINLLKDRNFYLPKIENLQADASVFSTFELENLKPEAILFQTGYITIKDVEDDIYCFDYPNKEVKISFLKHLLLSFVPGSEEYSRLLRLSKYLREELFDDFFEAIQSVFASIPYPNQAKRDEAYYHTLFYLMVSASGANANSEVLTAEGRIDLVVEFSDKFYIIEFKCNQSAKAAIKQIHQKNYALRYKKTGKKIILMGINFDSEKHNISGWEVEEESQAGTDVSI